jgi:hypothetical protein
MKGIEETGLRGSKHLLSGSIVRQRAGSLATRGCKLPERVGRLVALAWTLREDRRTLVMRRSTFPQHVTKHRRRVTKHCMRIAKLPLLAGKLPMSRSSAQGLTDREGERHGTGGRHTTNPGPATDCHISRNGNSELELPLIVLP